MPKFGEKRWICAAASRSINRHGNNEMHCPFCSHEETKVTDSRLAGDGTQIRRRRECLNCQERFTTFESAELVMPRLIKRDKSREPFNESKLRNGILRAFEKRPVSSEAIEALIVQITRRLQMLGERELPSRFVGEMVMEELRAVDEVAYVRFASVYRSFQDVTEFQDEIRRLKDMTEAGYRRDQMSLLPDEEE